MAQPWFKFFGGEWLGDQKRLALSPAEQACWIILLCYANQEGGEQVKYLTEERLMAQAQISVQDDTWDRTIGVLKKFEKLGMITNDNELITIVNWNKRQERSLTPYERVKRYRERHKEDNGDNDTDNVVDKNRIEVDKNSKSGEPPLFQGKIETKEEEYKVLVKSIATKDYLTPERIHKIVLEEFLPHWLEKGENAKKARWQKEKVFDYQKRIRTWIANYHKYAKDYRCRSDKWHRQGETCYCVKEEKREIQEPSAAAKELGSIMRIRAQ